MSAVALAVPTALSPPRVVRRDEILAAMRASQGYDPTATTNGARFQAEVLLRLVATVPAENTEARRFFIGHADWYAAYLERVGLPAEKAPLFARLSFENRQDLELDARPGGVIESVIEGPAPRVAANVTIGWLATRGGRTRYSYDDTLAIPHLRVTNERVMTYRLLDYGDVVVFDEITGLHGRPTEGFLGLLFDMIGEGSVRWSRLTFSPDGLQLARARATKGPFSVESTITVFPDGRMQKDLLPDRADLAALEQRLMARRRLRYHPLSRDHAPTDTSAKP